MIVASAAPEVFEQKKVVNELESMATASMPCPSSPALPSTTIETSTLSPSVQKVQSIDTVIVGGGQAGLATSRCLTGRNVPHIILERGRLVERWQSERWDSLRLLTPNWMTRLPGDYHYQGDDPDGYMTAKETIQFFHEYADSFHAPIRTQTQVNSIEKTIDGSFQIVTNREIQYKARNVVIATGFCDQARVPEYAKSIPSKILQLGPSDYHRPSQLPPGNVLIVGASATGCQIAQELSEYNKKQSEPRFERIIVSVGRHTRLPRCYRGKDILYWLDAIGFFRAPCEASKEREAPGPQIVGTPQYADLDLVLLQSQGVELVGHANGVKHDSSDEARVMTFANDLYDTISTADSKLEMLLKKIDDYIDNEGIQAPPSTPVIPVPLPPCPAIELHLNDIRTIIWATGYCRSYPFLSETMPEILDKNGDVRHVRGVTPENGLYILGMRFEMTRVSNFIDGVGADAEELAGKIAQRAD